MGRMGRMEMEMSGRSKMWKRTRDIFSLRYERMARAPRHRRLWRVCRIGCVLVYHALLYATCLRAAYHPHGAAPPLRARRGGWGVRNSEYQPALAGILPGVLHMPRRRLRPLAAQQ